jgi:hypothetical protein
MVYKAQPAVVKALLGERWLYKVAGLGWMALTLVIVAAAVLFWLKKTTSNVTSWAAVLLAFVQIALETVYRDGIRDMTLLSKGYSVWDRVVVTNWSVVGLFLVLFVAGLGVVGWLISVAARATRVMESAVEL